MHLPRLVKPLLGASILIVVLGHASGFYNFRFIDQLERWSYDARVSFSQSSEVDEQVVIIDIDENSLALLGRWPWSRDKLATLVTALFDHYQVNVVGVDIVFAEKDNSSGLTNFKRLAQGVLKDVPEYLRAYEEIRPSLMYDEIFAQSMTDRNIVLGYYFKDFLAPGESGSTGALPAPLIDEETNWSAGLPINRAIGYSANLETLQASAKSAGFFNNPFIDSDGVLRRFPLIQGYGGQLFGSLPLEVVLAHLGSTGVGFEIAATDGSNQGNYYELENLRVGAHRIPVDQQAAVYVPYRGPEGSFRYIPAHQIINREVASSDLNNKIILIGTSAPGLLDLRSTPLQAVYPGVEIHANIISGILDNRIKHRPAWVYAYELILLVCIAATMLLLLPLLTPLMATTSTLSLAGLIVAGTSLAWSNQLILPIANALILMVTLYLLHMSYGFFVESRDKRRLAGLFGQYIPPQLVAEMSESPENYALEGENREMTVLFSDVRGFTTISEGMNPKQLSQLMNSLLTPLTRVIHKHRGTIDKYMGDAIMSFWGAPLADSNHPRHALEAAIEMIDTLKLMQIDFKARDWPEINIGIGLHSGKMNVGNMGSEFRMAYTVLGDAVNLGSRIEGLTKYYKVDIIVSQATKDAIPEFLFRELDLVLVKGRSESVAIFEPVGYQDQIETALIEELDQHHAGLNQYRNRMWDQAEATFTDLHQAFPKSHLYELYLQRTMAFQKQPPETDWAGVFVHTSK